jgi:Protein of unknown function (DUF2934)
MADTAKKTKVAATPRQASASKVKASEAAEPTTTSRTGIELVAKVEAPKETKSAATPRKTAAKKDNLVAFSKPSREVIEQLAYQYWAQRGYQHGHAAQDWLRAEQELQERAS